VADIEPLSAAERIAEVERSHDRLRRRGWAGGDWQPLTPPPAAASSRPAWVTDALEETVRGLLPMIRQTLGGLEATALMVCDADLRIRLLVGDPDQPLVSVLAHGASLFEDHAGTNAVDLAVRNREATVTAGDDHMADALRTCQLTAAPLFDPDGGLKGCLAFVSSAGGDPARAVSLARLCARLLSAQIASHMHSADLRRIVSEQQAIVDHIHDGLIVIERSGRVKFMNAPAGRMLNVVPEQAIGRVFSELVDFEPIIADVFESGEGYVDREVIVDSPMRHLQVLDTAIPIKNSLGEVESVVNTFRDVRESRRLMNDAAGNRARYTFDDILGESGAMVAAVGYAKRAARGNANILLMGESGTGKEFFAQAIHLASERAAGPFVAINCAALPRDLIESELFGYVAGSFTGASRNGRVGKFEMASGGTVFLDEVFELPVDVQAKLLRVLQEREVVRVGGEKSIPVDIRVISASNRDLREMVERGQFREDLYYRLQVIEITLPALRDREGDIPRLANHYLKKYASDLDRDVYAFAPQAMSRLESYHWPGNVRELQNTVERLVNLADGQRITTVDLGPDIGLRPVEDTSAGRIRTLAEYEREILAGALAHTGYNIAETARLLGIGRQTVYKKIRRYGIALRRRQW
jgi:transcriptional regulator with PAS, ATPase and Fis domain